MYILVLNRSSAACWQQCPLLLHQTLATVCESPPPLLGSCGPRTTHWISVQAAHAVKRYMLMITKRIKDYNSFNKYKKYWMYIFRCVHLFLDIHYIHSFQRDPNNDSFASSSLKDSLYRFVNLSKKEATSVNQFKNIVLFGTQAFLA